MPDWRLSTLVAAGLALVGGVGPAAALRPCPGEQGGAFPGALRAWLDTAPRPIAEPGVTRDPATGGWRYRPGLLFEIEPGRRVRVVAPGRVLSARCGDRCTLVVEHGGGYVARYGGLSAIDLEPGACATSATVLRLARPHLSGPAPQLDLSLFRHGRFVDPRAIAGAGRREP